MVTQLHEKPLYLVLKQYHNNQQSYAHELVKDSSYKFHLHELGCNYPYHYKCEYAKKYVESTAFFHYSVQVEKQ